MLFEYYLTVPAATAASSPVTQEMDLAHGIIHRLEVLGDGGEHGLVLCRILHGAHQAFPTNPEGQMRPGFFPIGGPEWYAIEDRPYKMVLEAWSPTTTNIHYITARLWIERREILQPALREMGLIGRLSDLLLGRR